MSESTARAPSLRQQMAPDWLVAALANWQARLAQAGIACRGVALHGQDPQWQVPYADNLPELQARWTQVRQHVDDARPLALDRPSHHSSVDWLVALAVRLPDGGVGVVGAALVPPCTDRTIQTVMLALGWLQLELSAAVIKRSQRATHLLELLGHVASMSQSRAGAQEWINRTSAWVRQEAQELDAGFSLVLFEQRGALPRWWVAADTAWVEHASPAMLEATELATEAAVQQTEVRRVRSWALPVLDGGDVVAVLVAKLSPDCGVEQIPEPVSTMLRASLGLAEPLLRRWRQADRPLWRHAVDALRDAWQKVWGPGELVWKVGAGALVLAIAVLLLWPVPDRVSAATVIEGRVRQVVTAPFDGFIGQVMVRPGERVTRGQTLARLDARDLRLEQSRIRSERDQANGKLRQAMAERDAPAMALAQAEVQRAEAQLALVESKLGRTDLMAPMDGLVVTGDWVQQIGGPVETGKAMFEIASGEGYRVVLHVPDRDIARVRTAQIGTLRLTSQPQISHAFRVSTVTATASVLDGVNGFRVEADWQGEVPPLSPGMQGIGKIDVGSANLLTVWTRPTIDWLRLKLWAWWW
jgi:multidrug resistance efflux pump